MNYDVIVIGCGTGGSKAAATAAAAGARVLAIEGGEQLGGLCILRGCMPTKTLLETAHRVHDLRDAERFGIRNATGELDFGLQMERMRRLVARFRQAKENGIKNGGYELRWGRPRFVDRHTIELDGEKLSAKAFVLATGSRVSELPFPTGEGVDVRDSDDMFLLESPPDSVAVLGAGAVGLEFAQWLARMGTDVTLMNRSPLLRRFDLEIGEELARAFRAEMTVIVGTCPSEIVAGPGGKTTVRYERDGKDHELHVDFVLNAVGRVPDLDGLGLEAIGLDPGAGVAVDQRMRTPLDHVFAAGDAIGRRLILHEANLEGALAGKNAARVAGVLGGEIESYDPAIPAVEVIFTDPPFATVGSTAKDCETRGIAYSDAVKRFAEQGRGIIMGAEYGMTRLLCEPGGGKILGCQILGPRADDLIHIPATVMSFGGTAKQMHAVPWYHPTLAEAFIELTRTLVNA